LDCRGRRRNDSPRPSSDSPWPRRDRTVPVARGLKRSASVRGATALTTEGRSTRKPRGHRPEPGQPWITIGGKASGPIWPPRFRPKSPADPPRPSGSTRTDLQRHDLAVAGREVLQARVDFAPGAAFPAHRHPGEEIIYILEGTLKSTVEGKPPVTLDPGDVLFVPAQTAHAGRNVGSSNGSELATYVLEKGKPLTVFVK
jgi:quercetin dioxygenase-like cupin family protein